jgi:4-amino-4-deoxy-L-arabinose transferase-like glycosyltransferase
MFQQLNHRGGHYALLLAASAALFLINLGGPSLWDVDEGRNAGCAYEMLESGNYLVPTFNGELRVDKPPLLYWLQVAAYRLLGVNELAARLPSALAALLTVLLTYELGRALFRPSTGLLAGVVLMSTPMVCAAARFANPDALLNLFTVLPLLTFWLGLARTGKYPFVLVGLGMALAVLAKGPVGCVMPAAVMAAFLVWTRQLRVLWTPRLLLGVLAFAVVALPWYALVGAETKGQFLRGFLLEHNIGRFQDPMEDHGGGPFYYLIVLTVGFAPWSVFLGLAAWYGLRHECGVRSEECRVEGDSSLLTPHSSLLTPHSSQSYRFLWCWIGGYLLFFTAAATKLPNYILPLSAPLAVLTARWLDRWRCGEIRPARWAVATSLGCLALVGIVAGLGLAVAGGAGAPWLPPVSPFSDLAVWGLVGLSPVLGTAAAVWCLRRQRYGALIVSISLSAVLLVGPLAAWGLVALDRYKAARPLVQEAGALRRTEDIGVGCYELGHLPSLTFYCQRTVRYPVGEEEALGFLRRPTPVYLFLPEVAWERLQSKIDSPARVVSRHPDLYRRAEAVVAVTNR